MDKARRCGTCRLWLEYDHKKRLGTCGWKLEHTYPASAGFNPAMHYNAGTICTEHQFVVRTASGGEGGEP